MCCAINIRIAGTKYFCIQFLAEHLKLKITITFNLAQCLAARSPEILAVRQSTVCLAVSFSFASASGACFYGKTMTTKSWAQKLRSCTWRYFICHLQPRGHMAKVANLAAKLLAQNKTQVCHLPRTRP